MYDTHIQELAYDGVLYPDTPHFWSEPARFAAAATLHGFTPNEVSRGRILEVGCASGGNIIPMAARYPHATFFGFDISQRQIEAARRRADEIGLPNLTLFQADILALPAEIGTFDFIIGHGISSWVPPAVRIALWSICHKLLHDNGLVYLSYNTLPGWHFKRIVRDLLLFHTRTAVDAQASFTDIAPFFNRVEMHARGIYKRLLGIEKQFITERDDNYIRHEYLEAENHAFYIRDIINEAQAHELTYVCEADPTASNLQLLAPDIAQAIVHDAQGDRATAEQYIDFYINRTFRSSVFAKTADTLSVTLDIQAARIDRLHIVAVDIPPAPRHFDDSREFLALPTGFFAPSGDERQVACQRIAMLTLNYLKAALPSVSHSVMPADIVAHLPFDLGEDLALHETIHTCLLEYLYQRKLGISTEPVAWSDDIEKPRLFSVILSDAAYGRSDSANVLHEKITLKNDRSRLVMSLLDGTRDRAEIEQDLLASLEAGRFSLSEDEGGMHASTAEQIAAYFMTFLQSVVKLKLLVPQ